MKKLIVLFGMMLLFLSHPTWAQDMAEILGVVTDSTGAVVPGVKITVSNPAKGFTRGLVSNPTGNYDVPKVPIGEYVITAEATGFEKLVRSGIRLTVGQIARVDLQLKVGQVTQEVTVKGEAPLVQTSTGAISDVVTERQIANLDLNGRNFESLYLLVPGALADDSFDPTLIGIAGGANVSFNGNRMEYNNMEIDGGNNADEGSGPASINTFPSLDSIAEFRVSSSNYGADMGRHAGAQMEVATKAGTRDFHGDVYEYVRNDHFDANDWFINRQPWTSLSPSDCRGGNVNVGPCNAPKTPLKWNDYGYTFGGPFYIPGHYNSDKTKTFFFWSEEWRKYRQGTVIGPVGVPTVAMRKGDFSECDSASPSYNPVVAVGCVLPPAIPGRAADTVPIDPNALTLLDAYFPLPNNGPDSYVAAHSQPTNWREEQIRVDQNISDKTTAFLRFTNDAWNTNWATEQWVTGSGASDAINTSFIGPAKSAAFHLAHNFNPHLMNEFIMGYTVDHIFLTDVPGAGSVSHSITKPSNWTVGNLFTSNATNPLLPALTVCGGQPVCVSPMDGGNLPWKNSNPVIEWKDNIVDIKGNHTLKFGFLLAKYRKNEQFGTDTQGLLYFDAGGSITTGNALADLYLGNIHQYQEGTMTLNGVPVGGYPKGHWRSTEFEPYFQDDWKASRKLTLNIGARYYYFVPIHDVSRPQPVDSGFIPSLYSPANQAQLDINGNLTGTGSTYYAFGNGLVECGHNGIARGCRQPSNWTLAPRFGFAYDFSGSGKTVLRGGYGIYYEPGNGNESNTEGGEGNPPVALSPSGYNIPSYQAIIPGAVGPTSYTAIPYHEKWGSVQQYSLTLEHQFGNNNVLSVAYVGTLGRHLGTARALDQIPVGVGVLNAPGLAGFTAPNDFNPSDTTPLCDPKGNCDVQQILINNLQPNTFFAPYRGYSSITQKENTATSVYHALQTNFRHTFGRGLTFQAAYTWSHNIDNSTSTYFSTSVDDNFNMKRWRATSDLNRTHVLVLNYIYDLPFFKSSTNRLVRNGLGGWQISGITSFFTGEPIDFSCGVTDPISGSSYQTGIGTSVRCNALGPVKIKKGIDNDPTFGPTPTWWDPNMIAQPLPSQFYANNQPGMFGYMGRNFLTGPGRNNWDLALHKEISLPWFRGEHSTMQFRWETFNTFNHPQWGGPNGVNFGNHGIGGGCNGSPNNDGTAAFGRPCGGHTYNLGNGQVGAAWPPRQMQFALKLIF